MLPFTRDQFFAVFSEFNASLWPASLVAYVLAALTVMAIATGWPYRTRLAASVLMLMWAWTGIAYHLVHFAAINTLAYVFGALFIVQAALIARAALRGHWQIEMASGPRAIAGFVFIAYAAAVYPLIGLATGHSYGGLPQFGVTPCPVTLFTFGILLLSRPPVPWSLLIIPTIWSLIGGSAAFLLGVPQDWPLLASGMVSILIIWLSRT